MAVSSSRYKNIVTVKYSYKTGIHPESTRNPESQPESHRNPPGIRDPDRNFRNRWGSVNYSIFCTYHLPRFEDPPSLPDAVRPIKTHQTQSSEHRQQRQRLDLHGSDSVG